MNKLWIVPALLSLLVPVVANADPNSDPNCGPDNNIALGVVQVGTTAEATFYVDDRNFVLGNGIWVYQESNGVFDAANEPIWNLQRGGASEIVPDDSEICTDANPAGPDYLIL